MIVGFDTCGTLHSASFPLVPLERQETKSLYRRVFGLFGTGAEVGNAAKTGEPAVTALMPTVPIGVGETRVDVDPTAGVSVQTIEGESKLDTEPDARRGANRPQQEEEGSEGGSQQ